MRIFALALLLCVTSVGEAAQMPLSVLPGGAVIYKPIQSIRERKFADLVQQKTDFSCGAAALATILRQAYWLDVDEQQIIEGMLALTAARFMIKSLKDNGWFPGFVQGFTAVNRDESRHVGFGVKFLADAIKADKANARIIEDTLKECLPVAPLVFVPPWVDDPYNFETPFYHSSEIFEYAAKSLSKKLAAMGLDPALLGQPA